MDGKQNLPSGICVNDEFPPHMKKARDILRPILKLVKSQTQYKDKCKLQNDKLVVNGISYSIDDLHRLLPDLAPYKVAQKEDNDTITFHGCLSSWLNFHTSPFALEGKRFKTAEHWMQYSKATYFGDTQTASEIINNDTPQEAKRLGYQVAAFNIHQWREHGYVLSIKGV